LRDVHGFRGGRFGLNAERAREILPEDPIQLIGIEAPVFDDLADPLWTSFHDRMYGELRGSA
jgi:hypothetical protein